MLSPMLSRIDVAMTPAEAQALPRADCYLVIDVLRATTTIATLFARGLEELTVVTTVEEALARRAPGVLLFGERGGLRPEGFDYGNSPAEASTLELARRRGVLTTSNGTAALCAVAPLGPTAAAALANLNAASSFAAEYESVMVVCAGNGGGARFSLEDFAVAARIVQHLHRTAAGIALGDGARAALEMADPVRLLSKSTHSELLRSLGFADDVAFSAVPDTSPAVPAVTAFGETWAVLRSLGRP